MPQATRIRVPFAIRKRGGRKLGGVLTRQTGNHILGLSVTEFDPAGPIGASLVRAFDGNVDSRFYRYTP